MEVEMKALKYIESIQAKIKIILLAMVSVVICVINYASLYYTSFFDRKYLGMIYKCHRNGVKNAFGWVSLIYDTICPS